MKLSTLFLATLIALRFPTTMEIQTHASSEFDRLLNELNGNCRLINVFCILKFQLDDCYQDSSVIVRSIRGYDSRFFGITLEFSGGENLIVLLQSDSNDRSFVGKAAARMLRDLEPTMRKYDEILFSSVAPTIAQVLYAHFDSTGTHPFMPMNEQAVMFYGNREQRRALKKIDLQPPEDFDFVRLPVEAAAAICKEVIALKSKNQERVLESKIAHMPAIGIVHRASGELASYATNDGTGLISNLYTRPAYRRRGLAKLVEQKLAQLNLQKHGLWPLKAVASSRPRVIAMSRDSFLWSTVPNEVEDQETYVWIARTKTERDPILFLEN